MSVHAMRRLSHGDGANVGQNRQAGRGATHGAQGAQGGRLA